MRAHHVNHRKDKIQEALELLNEAAKEKREEVFTMLDDKYEHLREVLSHAASNGQHMAEGAKKQIYKTLQAEEKKLKQVASQWDRKVHKNPWVVIGGVALGSFVMGMIMSRKGGLRRDRKDEDDQK